MIILPYHVVAKLRCGWVGTTTFVEARGCYLGIVEVDEYFKTYYTFWLELQGHPHVAMVADIH